MSPKRRDFLKGAGGVGMAAIAAAALPEIAEAAVAKDPALQIKQPIVSNRILSNSSREVFGGKEHVITTEIVGANGVKHVTDTLLRDLGAHKIITMRTRIYAGPGDTEHQEVTTKTIFAEVLDVDGIDKTSVTVTVSDENGIRNPRTFFVKKGLQSPAEGAADDQEVFDKIFENKKLKAVR